MIEVVDQMEQLHHLRPESFEPPDDMSNEVKLCVEILCNTYDARTYNKTIKNSPTSAFLSGHRKNLEGGFQSEGP